MEEEGVRFPVEEKREMKKVIREELKKVSCISLLMVAVGASQGLMQIATMSMVGHLGEFQLSATAISTSLTSITGFTLQSGLVSGLETLSGQAYGAGQYKKVGVYTYSAMISLLLVSIPISVLWSFLDKFLVLIHQDPSISLEARRYSLWLIPALFVNAFIKPLVRFLQCQSKITPLTVSAVLVLFLHVPLSWVFIFKLELGIIGGAIAFTLSNVFYLIFLVAYIVFSPSCKDTRVPFSRDAFLGIMEFFRYAVPSAVMICLKWWSVEIVILLSGVLPNAKLETSVLSICMMVSGLHFSVPYGLGVAASTRVANELGAGNPRAAQLAVWVVMSLAVIETIIVSTTVFSCRHILGRAFSNEKQVVDYISILTPFICLSIVTDSIQATISGIARGCGWQKIGAYVNLVAFYLFGLPAAVVLGFPLHLKAKGLWLGIVIGSIIQAVVLSLITGLTNWQKQANKARERMSSVTPAEGSAVDS